MKTGFQPLILGHQRVIGGHYVVKGDRRDGLESRVCIIYERMCTHTSSVRRVDSSNSKIEL